MGLTLVEAAKLETGDVYKSGVIELYAGSSAILTALPFEPIAGNALKYNRESNYPGVGFRGVNEAYTPSAGVLNPLTEALVIAGGDLDVDKFIIDTQGANQRTVHESMKIRALSLAWTRKFIKGDTASDPREFDGLQVRVTGNQIISAGATANGTALSLTKLDEAISQTLNPTHIVMSRKMALRFGAAARNASVGGYVVQTVDGLGRPVMSYAGLPFVTVDLDNAGAEILPFTEAAASGTDTAASLYVVSLMPDGLTGIQNGTIDVRDMGELQTAPVFRTRIEWYNGMAIYNGRAVTRLRHISDAPITA